MRREHQIKGLLVAITTPFRDGAVDESSFRDHIEHLLANGVDGLVVCGTTGEAATMSGAEQEAAFRCAVQVVDGRGPVLAGVGTNATESTIANSKVAVEAGCDGLLIVTPYYNKPTQDGMVAHYRAILDAVDAPVMIYNVPGRTSVSIQPETVARLAEHPNIVAIKDATADLHQGADLVRLCGDRLNVLSGDDFTALPLISVGGQGVVSVVGNIAPAHTAKMVDAALAGDYETARRLHLELLPLVDELFRASNPIPVKRAVSMLGFGTADVRLPLVPYDEPGTASLRACMVELGLFTTSDNRDLPT